MTNYETIKAACIAANPEIVELKFGCEFYWKKDSEDRHFIYHVSQNHPFYFEAKTDGSNGGYLDYPKEEVEILGREIQLADVLLAISKTEHASKLLIDSMGGFWSINDEGETATIKQQFPVRWFVKVPLSGQSPETLEFIANLLK